MGGPDLSNTNKLTAGVYDGCPCGRYHSKEHRKTPKMYVEERKATIGVNIAGDVASFLMT